MASKHSSVEGCKQLFHFFSGFPYCLEAKKKKDENLACIYSVHMIYRDADSWK